MRPGSSIRVEVTEGRWETLGVDRYAGIRPEGIAPTFNDWGPDGLSFTLRRDPHVDYPDLTEFTPVELVSGERTVWDGFLIDTPSAGDGEGLAVNALGWQYVLDDPSIPVTYVHDRLDDWQDARTLTAWRDGSLMPDNYVVGREGGILTMGVSSGTVFTTETAVGVILDLGPDVGAFLAGGAGDERGVPGSAAIAVRVHRNGAVIPAGVKLYARSLIFPTPGHNSGAFANLLASGFVPNYSDAFNPDANTLGTAAASLSTLTGTFAVGGRYVALFLYNAGATYTAGANDYVIVSGIRVATNAAYLSGGASVLKASDVMSDVALRAPLLSRDTSLITTTSVAIPHLSWKDSDATLRQIAETANAFHGYRTRIRPGRRFEFTPQANRPLLAVNLGRGATFRDASTNSGRDSYNHVIARGRSGSGAPLRLHRWTDPGDRGKAAAPSITNASADANTSGWTANSGQIVRDAGVYRSSPGSFQVLTAAGGGQAGTIVSNVGTIAGPLLAGRRYRLRLWLRLPVYTFQNLHVWGRITIRGSGGYGYVQAMAAFDNHPELDGGNVWFSKDLVFTAGWDAPTPYDVTSPQIVIYAACAPSIAGGLLLNFDDVELVELNSTALDRRRRERTKVIDVGPSVDPVALAALADVELAARSRAAMKGELAVTLDDVVRFLPNGRPVAMDELGDYVGELIQLDNLVDPDTGAIGRAGIIRGVNLTDDAATVTLDNDRGSFEALIGRMEASSR